ncbi:MAG TPA: Rpn family recombination-promoting nuclease/putative transposase [Gammaproteobacteria bacterium]|nr:Rpn family recombination-promoting nuclease/putative transposase [Gammaproteobacteria bacterium]
MTKLVRFDWAIKYLLRNKANFDILEGFLSELLKTPIHIETILESEGNKLDANDKFNRVDLLVKTDKGQHIIIEVQCSSQWDYLSRILYGASKVVCEYLRAGDAYKNIHKVISVSIVFFNLGTGKDYLYHGNTVFRGLHYGDILGLNPHEQAVYSTEHNPLIETPEKIFPEYYLIKVTQFHEQVRDKLDEWIYFLKHGEIKQEFSAQGIRSAAEKLNTLHLNEEQRRVYAHYQEALHDEASLNEMFRVIKQEGETEGEARGEAKGRLLERQQIAKSLKQAGLSDQQIAEGTGLSMEEIRKL